MRFVETPNPRLLCFMGSMVSGNHAGAKHMSGRLVQTFPNVLIRMGFFDIPGLSRNEIWWPGGENLKSQMSNPMASWSNLF